MYRMVSLICITLLLFCQYSLIVAFGPYCMKCDRVRQPYDCTRVVRCGDHEECTVRRYLTDDGHRWFDVGCSDKQQCAVIFGRRSLDSLQPNSTSLDTKRKAGETTECESCCSNDLCNTGTLCGSNTLPRSGQLLCFKCTSEQAPDTCNSIALCSHDDECFMQSTKVGLGSNLVWNSGCLRKDSCAQFTQSQGSNCHSCCNSDICNVQCGKDCSPNPCVHGTCHNSASSYSCSCQSGYTGSTCNTAINHCSPNPCVHGTCHNSASKYTCQCQTGYTGTTCASDCSHNPCVHGTCHNSASKYTCTCKTGYTGTTCASDCSTNPCVHGTCHNSASRYTCSCQTGYTGTTCNTDCSPNPCVHGTCHNSASRYTCSCQTGYTGTTCNTAINHCSPNPCVHGTCHNSASRYTCSCQTGYTGTTCNADCSPSPCVHGTCYNSVSGYTCRCSTGYKGTTCNTAISPCDYRPCKNGGTCHGFSLGSSQSYYCSCPAGFKGTHCEYHATTDHCNPSPCVHGSCSNSQFGYNCNCYSGYTGTTCNTGSPSTGCPSGWIYNNRACYYFGTSEMSWSSAKAFCSRNGAHLARIEGSSEESFLKRQCESHSHSGHGYWIDGSDSHREGSWYWSTGSRISGYSDWNPGEPSNKYHDEDCLELKQKFGWRWNDETCSTTHLFICEK